MLNLVQVEVVLVVIVGAFVAVQVFPQLVLHSTVGCFRRQHIRILQRIGGGCNTGYSSLKQRGAGGNAGHEQQYRGGDTARDEEALLVPDKKAAGLFASLGGALCRLCGGLGRFDGIPRAVPRFCGGVFLFNGLLLLPTGIGIGSPAVFLLVLFVQRLEIGFVCGGFCLVRPAVGLFRMGAVRRFRNAPGALRRLGQGVRRLRAGVVVALLPELAVDCAADGIQRRFPCGVRQLGGRTLFVRLLKEKARRDLAVLTVHNALFDLNGFLGNFRFGLFQLNRRPVRLADSSFQLRQGAFFLGENQPWRAFCHIHHLLMGLLMD